eukprot:628385_1
MPSFQLIIISTFLLMLYFLLTLYFITQYDYQNMNSPYEYQLVITHSINTANQRPMDQVHYPRMENNISETWISYGSFAAIPYFYKIKGPLCAAETLTITSICDINQFYEAHRIASNYQAGPLSFAIYLDEPYEAINSTHLYSRLKHHLGNISVGYSITIGIVAINTSSPVYINMRKDRAFDANTSLAFRLPINVLRNLADAQVESNWLLNVDIDFWYFSDTLTHQTYIRSLLHTLNRLVAADKYGIKTVFVVPAFELIRIDGDIDFSYNALTKRQLLDLIYLEELQPFHMHVRNAQQCTAYKTWYRVNSPFRFDFSKIACGYAYEPWFIIHRNISLQPEYKWNNTFIGRGLNKVERVLKLRHLCFTFIVMNDIFMIHALDIKHHSIVDRKQFIEMHRFNAQMLNETLKGYLNEDTSCVGLLPTHDRGYVVDQSYPTKNHSIDISCQNGVLSTEVEGKYRLCCEIHCKTCGGVGCGRWGPRCCNGFISRTRRYCNESTAPCKMTLANQN